MSDNEPLSGLQAIDSYFSELLNDKPLKDSISVCEDISLSSVKSKQNLVKAAKKSEEPKKSTQCNWQNISTHDDFKVFYFEIFSVIYAVPLAQLGNVHKFKKCEPLAAAPDWYIGSQIKDTLKLSIVDMRKWAMPERIANYNHNDYQYIIMLAQSSWGLACNRLHDVEMVNNEQIKWRQNAGKRPWIAGLINEKKAVLLHVDALIAMLDQGVGTNEINQD